MPYKDKEKLKEFMREYQNKWLKKKLLNPDKRKKVLEVKAKWREKNREKLRIQARALKVNKTPEKLNSDYRKWKKTPSGIARIKRYRQGKGRVAELKRKSKIRYGTFWEVHLMNKELIKLVKEKKNV